MKDVATRCTVETRAIGVLGCLSSTDSYLVQYDILSNLLYNNG
jgi:hypothetical protein